MTRYVSKNEHMRTHNQLLESQRLVRELRAEAKERAAYITEHIGDKIKTNSILPSELAAMRSIAEGNQEQNPLWAGVFQVTFDAPTVLRMLDDLQGRKPEPT